MISVFVEGQAVPQGSKDAYPVKSGRINLVESSHRNLRLWRAEITRAVQDDLAQPKHRFERRQPVTLEVMFAMRRTTRLPKTGRAKTRAHTVKPDLDKLVRAIGDALTQAGVLTDDAQINQIYARKRYAHPDETPGLYLTAYCENPGGTA